MCQRLLPASALVLALLPRTLPAERPVAPPEAPAESDRAFRARPVVRHSSGPSRSRLNQAVYDRRRDWVLSVDVIALGTLAAFGAPGTQAVAARSKSALGEATEQYRGLDRDDAVSTVALWTQREVEAEAQGLLEVVEAAALAEHATPEEVARGEDTLVTAAALLSDAALRALRQGDRGRPRWDLQAAARLVHATRKSGRHVAFTRRYYLVAGLMLHGMGDLAGAFDMLSEGRRQQEDDAELLLALGAVCETITALRDYELPGRTLRPPGRGRGPRFVIEGQPGEGGWLPATSAAEAQALYVRALRQDSGLLEARLRLGRVLLLRGRPREALPELERVAREEQRADAARPVRSRRPGPGPRPDGREGAGPGGVRQGAVVRRASPARSLVGLPHGPAGTDRRPGRRSAGARSVTGLGGLLALVLAQAPPVFRAHVELVYVDVFVTKAEAPVSGLEAADFRVEDDGVAQRVELVDRNLVPTTAVLVLDTSASVAGGKLVHLKEAARAFLAGLGERDEAALVTRWVSHRLCRLNPKGSAVPA